MALGHVVLVAAVTRVSPTSPSRRKRRRVSAAVAGGGDGGAEGGGAVVVVLAAAAPSPAPSPAHARVARAGGGGGVVLVDGVVDGPADVAAQVRAAAADDPSSAPAAVVHAVHLDGRRRPLAYEPSRRPAGEGGASGGPCHRGSVQRGGAVVGNRAADGGDGRRTSRSCSSCSPSSSAVDARHDVVRGPVPPVGPRSADAPRAPPAVGVRRRLGGDGPLLAVEVDPEHQQPDDHDESQHDADPGADGGGVGGLVLVARPLSPAVGALAPAAVAGADVLGAVDGVVVEESWQQRARLGAGWLDAAPVAVLEAGADEGTFTVET